MSANQKLEAAIEIRDRLLPSVLAYAQSEGLSTTGAIQAALRMGAEAALAEVDR